MEQQSIAYSRAKHCWAYRRAKQCRAFQNIALHKLKSAMRMGHMRNYTCITCCWLTTAGCPGFIAYYTCELAEQRLSRLWNKVWLKGRALPQKAYLTNPTTLTLAYLFIGGGPPNPPRGVMKGASHPAFPGSSLMPSLLDLPFSTFILPIYCLFDMPLLWARKQYWFLLLTSIHSHHPSKMNEREITSFFIYYDASQSQASPTRALLRFITFIKLRIWTTHLPREGPLPTDQIPAYWWGKCVFTDLSSLGTYSTGWTLDLPCLTGCWLIMDGCLGWAALFIISVWLAGLQWLVDCLAVWLMRNVELLAGWKQLSGWPSEFLFLHYSIGVISGLGALLLADADQKELVSLTDYCPQSPLGWRASLRLLILRRHIELFAEVTYRGRKLWLANPFIQKFIALLDLSTCQIRGKMK